MGTSKYYLAAVSAYATWGFFSFVLKPLAAYGSLDILFYRVFFCAVLMLVISLGVRRKALQRNRCIFGRMSYSQKRKVVMLTFAGGLLLTANWFFFIYVMNHVSVKAASLAYMVCPILTTVLAYLILHEQLSRWQWVAVALSGLSCLLLFFDNLLDVVYSLIIAISYALYLVSQSQNRELDKFLLLTFQITFSALILLPFYPVYSESLPAESFFYASIGVIALVFTIIPLFLNLYAFQGINSSTLGILLYINPLINFLLAIYYYHEQVSGLQVTAYSLIAASVFIFNEKYLFKRKAVVA